MRSLEPGPDHTVVVVIPEFVVEHWWENLLHDQSALRLQGSPVPRSLGGGHGIPLHLRVARGRGAGLSAYGMVRVLPDRAAGHGL